MQRILSIICTLDPCYGGPVTTLYGIRSILLQLGYQIDVLAGGHPFVVENGFIFKNLSFPRRFYRSISANQWIAANARNYQLALVHNVWNFLSLDSSRILYKLSVPYIVIPHGSLDPFDLRKKSIAKRIAGPILIRKMLRGSRCVLCSTEEEAKRLETYGAHCPIEVLPWPVHFNVPLEEHSNLRNEIGFSQEDFLFLFMSRIDYKKGLEILIPAFRDIIKKHNRAKLLIAGSGMAGYETKIHKLAKRYLPADKYRFLGFIDGKRKSDAFLDSNCFVLPSMNENFGHSVVEALSYGLPVLISDNIYIHRDLERGGGTWICQYSEKSLYQQMDLILSNSSEYLNKKNHAKASIKMYEPNQLLKFYQFFLNKYCPSNS